MRRLLAPVVLFLILTGLSLDGMHAATMTSDQPAAMAASGMPNCDGCAGDGDGLAACMMICCAGDGDGLAACMMICGPSCTGELGQVFGPSEGRLVVSRAAIVPGTALPPRAALSPDPPRPKSHSL